jgi:glycosyltransferase A (GT-A) superfamily protein (DUF2064 family)
VLLFARSPRAEEKAKHIARAHVLFELVRERLRVATRAAGADLVEVTLAAQVDDGGLAQRGETFGERLENAFVDVRALGYDRIVAIPIDVPQITAADIAHAFELLQSHDHVIGPSPDGGVYLIGSRIDTAPLLETIAWNSDRVFGELLARAPEAAVLRMLLDVDGVNDLRRVLARCAFLDRDLAQVLRNTLASPPSTTPAIGSSPRCGAALAWSGRAPPAAAC